MECVDKFDFFIPVLNLLTRKDKQSLYWKEIKNLPAGSMPMMSVETTLSDGKQVTKLQMTKVQRKALKAATLTVPADYKKFEQ